MDKLHKSNVVEKKGRVCVMKTAIKTNLKSNLMSYIFCIGILFVVVLPISFINTSAATINAVATSTKEICRDLNWKNIVDSKVSSGDNYKSKSIYTVPSMDRTINKYIAFTEEKSQILKSCVANLGATKFIKSSFIQVKNVAETVNGPTAEKSSLLFINLSVLIIGFISAQIYFRKNEMKILMRRKQLHIKIETFKDDIKDRVNLFNRHILNMLEEETKNENLADLVIHNKIKNKKKFSRMNIASFLIYINAKTFNRVNYIETLVTRAFNGANIMERGHRTKFKCIINTS